MNKIYNDDCIKIMKEMDDSSIDIMVSDLPYLMDYKTNHRKNKDHEFCSVILGDNDPELISNYIKECYRILKDDTALYCFCNSNKIAFFINEIEKYFTIKNVITWVKNN